MRHEAHSADLLMIGSLLPSGSSFTGPAGDHLPHVPAMRATQLQLELLLQESRVDLRAVSEVILSDAGATLQVLRLVGEEYPDEEGRPTRIEDCIVSLSMDRCYEAVCASVLPQHSGALCVWQRCRRVAECARELAGCIEGCSPDEAYVVGLLYEVGAFPRVLGWNTSRSFNGEQSVLGMMLAAHWRLPEYLVEALRQQAEPAEGTHWGRLLHIARVAASCADAGPSN